jgi:hypothetical protein
MQVCEDYDVTFSHYYNLVENERCRLMDAYLERYYSMVEHLYNKQVADDTEYDKYNTETFG